MRMVWPGVRRNNNLYRSQAILAKILYIWEMGGGLGHLTTALPLARAYKTHGHQVGFVVKDLASAGIVVPPDIFDIYQAPIWQPGVPLAGYRPSSYAEIMLYLGFGDVRKLANMVRAWLKLLELLKPDLVVLDYSPTAMLAASIANIPHCTIGHGFFLPPRLTPVPGFVDGADEERLLRGESAVLNAINQVKLQFGARPLKTFGDFFESDLDLLTTWPELEHYPQRRNASYWGPVLMRDEGRAPDWPDLPGTRIFAYLYGNYPKLEAVLQAISASRASALIFAPGVPSHLLERFSTERIRFSYTPYAMETTVKQADAIICHSSFGSAWEAILAGKPLFCLPVHMEQQILAMQLSRIGVAVVPKSDATEETLTSALQYLLHQPAYRLAAERVAKKYADHDVERHVERLVEASVALVGRA